jgi:hypothetical protein
MWEFSCLAAESENFSYINGDEGETPKKGLKMGQNFIICSTKDKDYVLEHLIKITFICVY